MKSMRAVALPGFNTQTQQQWSDKILGLEGDSYAFLAGSHTKQPQGQRNTHVHAHPHTTHPHTYTQTHTHTHMHTHKHTHAHTHARTHTHTHTRTHNTRTHTTRTHTHMHTHALVNRTLALSAEEQTAHERTSRWTGHAERRSCRYQQEKQQDDDAILPQSQFHTRCVARCHKTVTQFLRVGSEKSNLWVCVLQFDRGKFENCDGRSFAELARLTVDLMLPGL